MVGFGACGSLVDPGPWLEDLSGTVPGDLIRSRARAVAFNESRSLIGIADSDGIVTVWSAESGLRVGEPMPHNKPVGLLAFDVDGERLLTAEDEGVVHLWEVGSSRPVREPVRGVSGAVKAVSPDGVTILVADEEGRGELWSTASGRRLGNALARDGRVTSLTYSPDGESIALAAYGRAEIWSAEVEAKPTRVSPTNGRVWGLDVSPDGGRVLVETGPHQDDGRGELKCALKQPAGGGVRGWRGRGFRAGRWTARG